MVTETYKEIVLQDNINDIEHLEILKNYCEEHNIKLNDLLMYQIIQKLEDISYYLHNDE